MLLRLNLKKWYNSKYVLLNAITSIYFQSDNYRHIFILNTKEKWQGTVYFNSYLTYCRTGNEFTPTIFLWYLKCNGQENPHTFVFSVIHDTYRTFSIGGPPGSSFLFPSLYYPNVYYSTLFENYLNILSIIIQRKFRGKSSCEKG